MLFRSDADAARQLSDLAGLVPGNLALAIETVRLAVRRQQLDTAGSTLEGLAGAARAWPEDARAQLVALREALSARDVSRSARAAALLRNLLAQVPAFRESLAALKPPSELVTDRLDRFVVAATVPALASPADRSLTYAAEALGGADHISAAPGRAGDGIDVFLGSRASLARVGDGASWPFAAGELVVPVDWNHDFLPDLLVAGASRLALLRQDGSGRFEDATALSRLPRPTATPLGAWAADLDQDGDLDLVIGQPSADSLVLKNRSEEHTSELQSH